jgi:putative peptidoglycan lipid II flippase
VSGYIDTVIASLLPTGAVTALFSAQLIYTLPVSLFGMSIAASELPAMAGAAAGDAGDEAVRRRLELALRNVAFFVVPSAMAFLALGDVIAGALLQTGRFTAGDVRYVWAILAGSAVGLLASTIARLYASTFYARRDTRTPLRCAAMRIACSSVGGYVAAVWVPRWTGMPALWGAAGLTVAGGIAGWVEMVLLRRALAVRMGQTGLGADFVSRLWAAAATAAAVAWGIRWLLPEWPPLATGALVLLPYGVVYFGVTSWLGVPPAGALWRRLMRP